MPLSKKHGLHQFSLMGLFTDSLPLYSWAVSDVDARPEQRIATDFFACGELYGRMSHDGLAWYAKNLEIREICGRQLSAQCAKELAGCFYSPTDLSDKHRCHADCLSITQIAPSARQIDTDFSQAESNMYGSMPHDGACLIRGRSV